MDTIKKVLIVEDSSTIIEQVKLFLKPLGVTVINAGSEFGMFQSIESYGKCVDLVLMDITLKSENGIDLIKSLRKNEKYEMVPVVIITEHAKKEWVLEAKKLKVDGFLRKPIDKDQLLQRVDSIINKKTD